MAERTGELHLDRSIVPHGVAMPSRRCASWSRSAAARAATRATRATSGSPTRVLVRRLSIRHHLAAAAHAPERQPGHACSASLIGIAGALMLAWNDFWPLVSALVLLQLSFVLDYSDGEIARYRAHEQRHARPTPAAPTWTGSATTTSPRSRSAALAYGAFTAERPRLAAAGGARGDPERRARRRTRRATTCCSACSATGPELRGVARVHARGARAPGRRPRAARPRGRLPRPPRRCRRRGLLWRRWTNLGQVLVFPGFVNLSPFVVRSTCSPAAIDGDYPAVHADHRRARC